MVYYPHIKKIFSFLLFFVVGIHFLAGQGISVQDILYQWTAIERRIYETQFQNSAVEAPLLNTVDSLYKSTYAFQNSEMHRIFRLIPLGDHFKSTDTAKLVADFRKALVKGEKEQTLFLSADIYAALNEWLEWNNKVERFSGAAYFRLLVVFLAFIILSAAAVLALSKTLVHSLNRESEGSGFSYAFLLAQEEERERISRELHDTIAQDLRCLSLGMEKISRTENPAEREILCDEAAAAQSGLIRRVRDICDYLVPPDFRFQKLGDAVRRLCLDFSNRTGIDCRAEIEEGAKLSRINREQQLQVFRIVQEALTNIEKHAEASEAIVIVREETESVHIGISDDGKGFTPAKENAMYFFSAAEPVRLGIWSMNKRAELLGGSLAVKSEQGEGTLVCLKLPSGNEG